MATVMGSGVLVPLPHMAELPQSALKASVVLLPHMAELPQRAELPHIADWLPTNAFAPQTVELPHIAELPQSSEESLAK